MQKVVIDYERRDPVFQTAAELLTQAFITSKKLCCIEFFLYWTWGTLPGIHDRNMKYRNANPVVLAEACVKKDTTFEGQDFQK